MDRNKELQHLENDKRDGETPNGLGLRTFLVDCPNNAAQVLAKVKEVLRIVLQRNAENWPSETEWRSLLPQWFIAQCAEELTADKATHWLEKWDKLSYKEKLRLERESKSRWSLCNWIYWFRPEADERNWYWWSSELLDQRIFRVTVEVEDWPSPWEALEWLFLASGANSVGEEG